MIKKAIIEFNKMANTNLFRISYELYIIHIALTNFQIIAFEKLDSFFKISF